MNEEKKTNEYALSNFNKDPDNTLTDCQRVVFYEMYEDGSYENGTTLEEMLRVCIERLTDLNSRLSCVENEDAIGFMETALRCLHRRTHDREKRGVKGKHEL